MVEHYLPVLCKFCGISLEGETPGPRGVVLPADLLGDWMEEQEAGATWEAALTAVLQKIDLDLVSLTSSKFRVSLTLDGIT